MKKSRFNIDQIIRILAEAPGDSGAATTSWINWGHPLKGKSQDKNPSLLKKPHKKSFYLYRHYDYAHLSISHPLFLLFLVTKKFSSNYSAPVTHQDQGSIYFSLPPKADQKIFGTAPCPNKNNLTDLLALMSNPFWLMVQAK